MATEEIEISELEFTEELVSDNLIPVESATDTKATSLQILKNWLSSFFVGKTGNETIGGVKTFTSSPIYSMNNEVIIHKDTVADRKVNPTSERFPLRLAARDKNNVGMGYIEFSQLTSGSVDGRLVIANEKSDGTQVQARLGLGVMRDGTVYTYAPTPPKYDNSKKIATTDWVNTFCKETNKIVVEANQTGDSWYRKYSDGWIEQGGRAPVGTGEITVNLVRPMKDGNYSLICTANFSSATAISYIGRYATNFKAVRSANTIFTWEVRGYGA